MRWKDGNKNIPKVKTFQIFHIFFRNYLSFRFVYLFLSDDGIFCCLTIQLDRDQHSLTKDYHRLLCTTDINGSNKR